MFLAIDKAKLLSILIHIRAVAGWGDAFVHWVLKINWLTVFAESYKVPVSHGTSFAAVPLQSESTVFLTLAFEDRRILFIFDRLIFSRGFFIILRHVRRNCVKQLHLIKNIALHDETEICRSRRQPGACGLCRQAPGELCCQSPENNYVYYMIMREAHS